MVRLEKRKGMLDKEGFTPSHVAAPDNFVPFVRPLLENRVNINMQNKQLSDYGFPVTSPTSHADVIAVTSMAPNAAAPDYQALHGVQTTSFGCNSHSLTKPGRKKPSPSASMKKNGTLPKEGVKSDGQKNGGMELSPSSSMRKDGNLSETGANVDRQPAEREKTLPSVSKRKSGNLPKKGVKVDGQKTEKENPLPSASKRMNGNPPKKGAEVKGQKTKREKPFPDSKEKSENFPKKRAKLSTQKTIGLANSLAKRVAFIAGLLMVFTIPQGVSSSEVQLYVKSPVIVQLPETIAVIRCSFTTNNNTNADILWSLLDKDEKVAVVINRESGHDFKGSYYIDTVYMEPDSCTLVFTNLRKDYSGNYSVSVFDHKGGHANAKVRLIILPPKRTASLSVQSSVEIKLPVKTAVLPCNYTVPEDMSDDKIRIVWTRNGVNGPRVLETDTAGKVNVFGAYHLDKGCSLVLEDPGVNNSGTFTVTLYQGRHEESRDVQVNVFSDALNDVHDSGLSVTAVVLGVIIPVVVCTIGIFILWIRHGSSRFRTKFYICYFWSYNSGCCIGIRTFWNRQRKTRTVKLSATPAEGVPLKHVEV